MRRHKIRYIFLSLILPAIWITLVVFLYYRHSTRNILEMDPEVSISDPTQVILRQDWKGLYLNGKKIGYSHTILKTGPPSLDSQYEILTDSKMIIQLGGTPHEINISEDNLIGHNFKLRNFRFKMNSGRMDTLISGSILRNQLRIKIDGLGGSNSKFMKLASPPYSPSVINLFLLKEGFPLDKTYKLQILEPSSLSLEDMEVRITNKERILINGTNYDAFIVVQKYKGFEQKTWISDKGAILKENVMLAGLEMDSISESEEKATDLTTINRNEDILYTTTVPVTGDIINPREAYDINLNIKGFQPEILPVNDTRQQVLSRDTNGNGFLLHIASSPLKLYRPSKVLTSQERTLTTEPSALIQSDDASIIRQARAIVGKENSRVRQVELLTHWLHKNIRKKILVSIPSARDVLANKEGDCNEHSTLFTALARSLGIPTKLVVGIVYVNGGFFYHAWNEVWMGEWVPIDSTFGQTRVDATHIKLFEGELDQQYKIFQFMGKTQIEILDSKAGKPDANDRNR